MTLADDRRDFIKRVADELERSRSQSDPSIHDALTRDDPPGVIPTSPDEAGTKIVWAGNIQVDPPKRPDTPTLKDLARTAALRDALPSKSGGIPKLEDPPGSPTEQYIELIDSEEERECIRESMDILYGKDDNDEL